MSHDSERTCVGCRATAHPDQLVRITVTSAANGPQAVLDPERRLGGRGAWLHPDRGCVRDALRRRAFHRAFRTAVDTERLGNQLDAVLAREHGAQKESESETDGKPMSAQR